MEPGEFRGTIGRYHWESTPWWPDAARPPAGTPNVVLVVLDDVGFAQLGCFGSDLDTPAFDALAASGLRYRNFHTTALCSPTRACLLTGRNHHAVGMGRITDLAMGFPGYDARIPRATPLLPELLVPRGYAAWAVGKWHLTPDEECHLGASRARWPLGRGFERFYGFFPGETHQNAPALVHDNHSADPPGTVEDGYHLTEDLVDVATAFVRDLRHVDTAKPFFLYFAPGACHSPHQAPREWIDRYRGRFDEGWDVWREQAFGRQLAAGLLPPSTRLSERPEWVPAWADLSADERAVYARYMEAFAGYLSHTDHHIGRLLDGLEATGDRDRTLVILVSDNGASSEGGPTGSLNDARVWNLAPRTAEEALPVLDEIGGPRWHNNYPWGWTVAGNTPFRRWKREVHEGGVADPMIVSWPQGIAARGEVRHQYVHAIDVAPTILDVLGVEAPALDGTSFAPTFGDGAAPDRHRVQYYEMFGCRALYQDGWKAVVYHPIQDERPGLDRTEWELYDVARDPAETEDLAGREPERLRRMVEQWWEEAERNQVLPLDNRPFAEFVFDRPPAAPERSEYVYWPGTGMVTEEAAANTRNRDHDVSAEIDVARGEQPEGVLCSQGSLLGGWSLFVRGGQLVYVHNVAGWHTTRVAAPLVLGPGAHTLGFRFTKTAEYRGTGALVVDGAVVAEEPIRRVTPVRFSLTGAGFWCGRGGNLAVCDDYIGPFPWSGTLHRVVIRVAGPPHVDPDAEAETAIRRQ